MAATVKSPEQLRLSQSLNYVSSSEEYDKMISGVLLVFCADGALINSAYAKYS